MRTREECIALDAKDELATIREEFTLDEREIYLDGNSLGPVSRSVRTRVEQVIDDEWGRGLVRSWNDAGWMAAPTRLGDRLARLIGAQPGEVLVADTLTILLAKLVGAALEQRPDRHVVLTDVANFHSDIYIIEAMCARAGRPITLKTIDRNTLDDELNDEVALVELTQVDYRTGEALDMKAITTKVHAAGALMLWDFAHSTGALPLDVTDAGVDFAVGCGYKYLNGGPGAPSFVFVAERWQDALRSPLSGWMGHAAPFAFDDLYRPAPDIRAQLCGTPAMLGLVALEAGVDQFHGLDMSLVEAKGRNLAEAFIALVEARCGFAGLSLASPRASAARGSHVSFAHPMGYEIMQALIERGVIGDFRAPDILRFGFTPLYLGFSDLWDAVETLRDVLASEAHLDPRHLVRAAVT